MISKETRKYRTSWMKEFRKTEEYKEYRKKYESAPEYRIKRRTAHFKRSYGITYEQFEEMRKSQDFKCKICERDISVRFNIDHCHKTGKVRGVLCNSCNRGIGMLQESVEVMKKAIDYLEGKTQIVWLDK